MKLRALLGCIALAAVACAGNGAAPPVAEQAAPAGLAGSPPRAEVVIRIGIPAGHRTARPALRHQRFVAAATKGLQLLVYKPDSHHVPENEIASLLLNLSPGAKGCTTNPNGSRVCTAKLGLTPPAVDFAITTWDQPPAKKAPAGKELAAGSFPDYPIKRGRLNQVRLTLGGIPASLAVVLPSPSPVAGVETAYLHGTSPSNVTMGVEAFDADGEQIVADGFVDASGEAQSVSMSVTPSAQTCGSAQLSSAKLASPPPGGIAFEYGETATAQIFTAGSPCTFAISAALGSIRSPAAAFALLGPELTTYAVSGLGGAPSAPDGIVAGPDGNVWFADTGASAIGEVNVQATPFGATSEYAAVEPAHAPNAPLGITVGPDNNLWFTESARVGQISAGTPTLVHTYAVPTPPGFTHSPALSEQIVSGPADVLVWFTFPAANEVYSINTGGGALKAYTPSTPSPAGPTGISAEKFGGSYLLWFVANTTSYVDAITPDGVVTHTFPIANSAGTAPQFVITDNVNDIWYMSCTQRSINSVNSVTGFVNSYPAAAGSKPWGLTFGPDNAVWFADLSGYIDRIPTNVSSPQVTQYAVGAGAKPKWITVGPDGALWFTESGTGTIGRITY